MVQNDLETIKDKIRQLESGSGSGSTVGSDVSTAVGEGPSGTFARPPPGIAILLDDLSVPRMIEVRRWVTDYKQCSYQGLSETEASNFILDLNRMVPDPLKKVCGLGSNQNLTRNMANKNYGEHVVWQ